MGNNRSAEIKLFDNCIIKTKCCSFSGNLKTKEGVKPDSENVKIIKQMKPTK